MPDLILEIGTEEIPAGFIPPALDDMKQRFKKFLEESALSAGGVETLGTPRRLTLIVRDLPARQADREEEILGPPKSAAFNPDGTPTKAGLGFAKAKGVSVEDLGFKETPKGEYVCIRRRVEGKETAVLLAEFLPKFILSIPFKKSMRWGEGNLRFARPIHWILALFDGKVIPFELDGLQTGDHSRGHRFLAPESFDVTDVDGYLRELERRKVMVDPVRRREAIRQGIEAALAEKHHQWLEDPELLEEVAYLVEYPFVVMGGFDEAYLDLPREVLVTAMREHQRYFSVLRPDGTLAPFFIAVNNTYKEGLDTFVRGHERVLRARLEDAKFFFEEDRKVSLEQRVEELKGVVFHAKLGTSYEKVQRIIELSEYLAGTLGASKELVKRAAFLCKADLVSEMVGEFPSLQGVMGRIYARLSGEPEEVCEAIFEHYLPRYAGDALPVTRPGIVLGLADRMDSLTGLFAVGMAPSGSADPYGLRRTASGLVQILLDREISLSLAALADQALGAQPVQAPEGTLEAVLEFVRNRLRVVLRDEGLPYDVVEAALAAQGDDPLRARETAVALARWVAREDWALILDNYARCVRITRDQPMFQLDPDALTEAEEIALYQALLQAEARVQAQPDVDTLLESVASMVPVIQAFFDKVLVMTSDETLRQARLALLQRVAGLATGIVDLSRLEGF